MVISTMHPQGSHVKEFKKATSIIPVDRRSIDMYPSHGRFVLTRRVLYSSSLYVLPKGIFIPKYTNGILLVKIICNQITTTHSWSWRNQPDEEMNVHLPNGSYNPMKKDWLHLIPDDCFVCNHYHQLFRIIIIACLLNWYLKGLQSCLTGFQQPQVSSKSLCAPLGRL